MDEVDTKLSAARTRLLLDKPFLGALALRLPLIAANAAWCKTTATDARALYYNPRYVADLSLAETEFILAHEALHCALSHFARRQHRVKHRWDLACDLAINPLLVEEGLTPPPGALYLTDFEGMTAEEIYPLLEDNNDAESFDQHLYDDEQSARGEQRPRSSAEERQGGTDIDADAASPQPSPLSSTEREALNVQWQQRLAGAAQQALQAGKLRGAMARLVDHLLQPQLPWRTLLAHYLTATARDDYSFSRPSRREGTAILPSLRSHQVELVVIVDTSGSVTNDEVAAFLAEVDALKAQIRARITLHACDSRLAPNGPWICEAWEKLALPSALPGGGGTNFVPAFEWIAMQDRAPDLLLYFTDAEGVFPDCAPAYPVIWLIKGRGKVPWGQRIQLN
jgi:predicted metal-dependent peptidase